MRQACSPSWRVWSRPVSARRGCGCACARRRRRCPRAAVLNLVAPLGITTRLLLDAGLDAIGVCELPRVTLEGWIAATATAAGNTSFRYAGLNHLGWFWDVRAGQVDVLARATE